MAIDFNKNLHLWFYIKGYYRYFMPKRFYQSRLDYTINKYLSAHPDEVEYINDRVNYYCKLSSPTPLSNKAIELKNFKKPNRRKVRPARSTYFFDTYEYTRFFPDDKKIIPLYGDINYVPQFPSITKSRPIDGNNANSVILNLDKVRHFIFLKDSITYEDKIDKLIGYMTIEKPHRALFMTKHFSNPMCILGQINKDEIYRPEWLKPKITIAEHLKYKFILSIEGADVASNLKWIMSSNSIPVMPKLKYETWAMEGRLIPNYNYICIKSDYSDLNERLQYYIDHPNEAKAIIEHNHQFIAQFQNKERERVISLLVLKRYFLMTNQ
ncbi:MAG: glycosyl transferase family 90 [Bacteroidia bacterium]|nr:glycosyl transferase family 90 [Bacteroidia bacterium]